MKKAGSLVHKGRGLYFAPSAVLVLCFLLGCFVGAAAVRVGVGEEGVQRTRDFLVDYLSRAGTREAGIGVFTALWFRFREPLLLFLLGLSSLGVAGVPILFSLRGFLFSFAVAVFCHCLGAQGLLPACLLIGLPALFSGPVLLLLGAWALRNAREAFLFACGRSSVQPDFIRTEDLPVFCFCLLALAVCAVVESCVVPLMLGVD